MSGILPPLVAELGMNISEFKAKATEARHEMQKVEKEGGGNFSKLGKIGGAALAGLAGGAVAFGGIAVKAALDGEKAHAQLVNAVKNSGASFKSVEPQIEALSRKFAGFGYENDEVEASLTRLTSATKNPKAAMIDLGVAADLAKARHISLEQAATLVSKVSNGNVGALGRMGIATKDAAGHTLSAAAAMKMLAEKFGGSAQAEAGTYAGKIKSFEANIKNLVERLGNELIPVLTKYLVPAFQAVVQAIGTTVNWFKKHTEIAKIVAIVVGTLLVGAVLAYVASMAAAAAATIAATWPILAIIAIIGGLVAAIVYAYDHWAWFRTAVTVAWEGIKAAASAVADWFTGTLWPIIQNVAHWIGDAFGSLVGWFQDHWDAIKTVTTAVWDFIAGYFTGIWDSIAGVFRGAWGVLSGIFNLIRDLFTGHWSKLWDDVKQIVVGAWDGITGWLSGLPLRILHAIGDLGSLLLDAGASLMRGLWNGITGAVSGAASWVGDIASKIWKALKDFVNDSLLRPVKNFSVSIPIIGKIQPFGSIPLLASGTRNFAGGVAIVGENGPELVNLPRGSDVYRNGTAPAGGTTFGDVHIHGANLTARDVSKELGWLLRTA